MTIFRTILISSEDATVRLTVTEAKARLTDVVKQAEAGEDIILTRHGKEVARIVGIRKRPSSAARRKVIEAVRRQAARKANKDGPSAAHSQDFLYESNGLPG